MRLFSMECPCCGHLNKDLYLEDTKGLFECEACGQVTQTKTYLAETSTGDEIRKRKKAMTGTIFPAEGPLKKVV